MDIRRLSYLAVVAIMAALIFYSISPPKWESQFQATGLAMEHAKTWKLQVSARPPGEQAYEFAEEVVCPKEYHSARRKEPIEGKPQTGLDLEVWVVGDKAVQRLGDKLLAMKDRGWPPECGKKRLFELQGVPLYPVMMMTGHAVRGGKKTINGMECRVWTAQLPKGDGWGDVYDVCIDKKNFPLELVMKDGSLTARASHWDEPIQLPQPPDVPPEPEAPNITSN